MDLENASIVASCMILFSWLSIQIGCLEVNTESIHFFMCSAPASVRKALKRLTMGNHRRSQRHDANNYKRFRKAPDDKLGFQVRNVMSQIRHVSHSISLLVAHELRL